jgi:hypothetical protein
MRIVMRAQRPSLFDLSVIDMNLLDRSLSDFDGALGVVFLLHLFDGVVDEHPNHLFGLV